MPVVPDVPAYVASTPRLLGRGDALQEAASLAGTRPGVIVVAGERGVGRARMARETAARLALDGAVVITAETGGPPMERLAAAMTEAGHDPDPARAARLRPIVVLLGDCGDAPGLPGTLARRLAGSRALVLVTADAPAADAPALILDRLSPDDAAALARRVTPSLSAPAARAVAELGDGLPGRIVPLAHAARRWPGGDVPLALPPELVALGEAPLAGLTPWLADLAGWVAVVEEPTTPLALARVCQQHPPRIELGLSALVDAGVLVELPGPPAVRWAFRERLVRAAVLERMGGPQRRLRHAAALVAARSAAAPPELLLRHALGAADPPAIVAYGTRAAAAAREAGDPETALGHARSALAWWNAEIGESARLAAVHERGMALLDTAAWQDAAEHLEEAAEGRGALGEGDAALASISAAASARWSQGQHDVALAELQDHLARSRDPLQPPSAARAEALTEAAGMAVQTSRFGEALTLAGEARDEARAAGADEIATRALIFMGMAESGRGGEGGLAHLARARREGEEAAGSARRTATLAMIHESHVLLALGRPDDAAARARRGIARARELGLTAHELVLEGNLGEALAAAGELAEARRELERAAEGWAELDRDALSPADPGIAWLMFAEGDIDGALARYRGLAPAPGGEPLLFEQIAPVAAGHALAAAAAGEDGEATRVLLAALGAWSRTDDRLTSVLLLAAAPEVLVGPEGDECVAALEEMAAGGRSLAAAARSYGVGSLARRRGEPGAAEHLRAAATRFEGLGLRWWSARARYGAGLADGTSDSAADDLLEARAAFRDMGAEGWRRRAEARLRAIGRRIPTRARQPVEPGAGLSAREHEVLAQLALGLRNRDIGERLFISERTVARHLVQINAKLGVSNRTAAVHEARQRGLLSAIEDVGADE